MNTALTEQIARQVLRRFPAYLQPRALIAVGNRGGFSGARLWRVSCDLGEVCLRAWPPHVTADTLNAQHEWQRLARSDGMAFVPTLYACISSATWIDQEGRLWQAESWQPGHADFAANPSAVRLQAASTALARLHESWNCRAAGHGPVPAISRRISRAEEWLGLISSGWRPTVSLQQPLIGRAFRLLEYHVPRVPRLLKERAEQILPRQPCLCDVRHDHVLFTAEAVTGIVDFGGAKVDHASVDIARLLGSLVGSDHEQWAVGLAAYRAIRPLSVEEEELARILDETGTIIGLVNWLLWICRDGRNFEDWDGVARRLSLLVNRLDKRK
jgi:Ser/Thr protein kinase RdoA (MazF antagonist)